MQGHGFNPWVQEDRTCCGAAKPGTTTEPTRPRACALQQEKPLHWGARATRQQYPLTVARESPHTTTKTQSSHKWINKIEDCKRFVKKKKKKKDFSSFGEFPGSTLVREDALDGIATHSSILAWRIPWTEAPGGLQSKGSQRAGHDWRDLARTYRS